jgi:hypothetical protein
MTTNNPTGNTRNPNSRPNATKTGTMTLAPPAKKTKKVCTYVEPAHLMRFQECAHDGGVSVKTIGRWVEKGLLTEWRPHPKSRTRRIIRQVWDAFKQRLSK